jgi:hypothetical protein
MSKIPSIFLIMIWIGILYTQAQAQAQAQITPSSLRSTQQVEQSQRDQRYWDWLVLPALNFTSDRGLGYGALGGAIYRNKDSHHQFHAMIAGQFYQSTKGYVHHKIFYDLPRVIPHFRLDGRVAYEAWDNAPYYGMGNTVITAPSQLNRQFYSYGTKQLWVVQNVRWPIPVDHRLQLLFSYTFRFTDVSLTKEQLPSFETRIDGKNGGIFSQMALGLVWDSRDREPSTQTGILTELSLRASSQWIGSAQNTYGINLTHRQWFEWIKDRLVFAWRIALDYQAGDLPFYQANTLGGNQWVELGSQFTMRGYAQGRYRGNLAIYQNLEFRWHWKTWQITPSKTLGLSTVPWIDLGLLNQGQQDVFFTQRFDGNDGKGGGNGMGKGRRDLKGLPIISKEMNGIKADLIHPSFGIGKRLIYNEMLVLRVDLGFARENMLVWQKDGSAILTHPWVHGVYVMVGQLF